MGCSILVRDRPGRERVVRGLVQEGRQLVVPYSQIRRGPRGQVPSRSCGLDGHRRRGVRRLGPRNRTQSRCSDRWRGRRARHRWANR